MPSRNMWCLCMASGYLGLCCVFLSDVMAQQATVAAPVLLSFRVSGRLFRYQKGAVISQVVRLIG